MQKLKLKHYSLIFSIVGIFVLYFVLKLSPPPIININEMPKYEGKQIIVEGLVLEHHRTKYGSQIIKIENKNTTTTIFVEGKTEVEFGDKIQVTGEVQKYEGEWEIVVNSINQLKIIEKWRNLPFPFWQLAESPSKYLGLEINISGYVDYISNSYFYLTDFEKKYSLIVFYQLGENITISPGQKISVFGQFLFDEENFRYKLELNKQTHSITFLEE
jgi:hypothetical protein